MSAKKGLKAFLLFENLGWDDKHGCYAIHPVCIVVAESFENAAEPVGGEFAEIAIARHEKAKSVVFPKSLFKPTKEADEHFAAGELLEYRRGDLYLCITRDEEMKVLQIMELPFFEQEFIELLSTTKIA